MRSGTTSPGRSTPHRPPTPAATPVWGVASQHQAGMGWQVEVRVVQDPKDGVQGLANVDLRTAKRRVTFWAMKWNTAT